MTLNQSRFLLVLALIVLAVISRWLPHPPNFSPLIGVALLAGARLSSRYLAMAVPLVSLFISDLILGWHSTIPYVYLGVAFTVLCGWQTLKANQRVNLKLGVVACMAALGFFAVSNFGVWITQDIYSRDLNGLVACYVAALPFFQATLISGLIYSYALFGLMQLAESKLLNQEA